MNKCQGCGEDSHWDVCWDCVKARHRAVLNRRCTCPESKRRPRFIDTYVRAWWSCDRCLGAIVTMKEGTR